MLREVQPGHIKARVIRFDLAQKATGATSDIEQLCRGAPGESGLERHERLTPHGGGGSAEQHFDLMVVTFGRSAAQIAVALKVKPLQVIARVPAARHVVQKALLALTVPPSIDRAQVGKKIDSPTHRLPGAADTTLRARVIAAFDIAPILLDQGPEISEDALFVRHRAPAQPLWQWHRSADPCRQQLLAKEPGDSRGLRGVEGELIERERHRDATYRAIPLVQGCC